MLYNTIAAPSFNKDSPSIIVPSCFDVPMQKKLLCHFVLANQKEKLI